MTRIEAMRVFKALQTQTLAMRKVVSGTAHDIENESINLLVIENRAARIDDKLIDVIALFDDIIKELV